MAFQSDAAPPLVGEAHKDTNDGDSKSEDETEEEEDLEEGEILDSGNEMEVEPQTIVKAVASPTPMKQAKDQNASSVSTSPETSQFAESSIKKVEPSINHKDKIIRPGDKPADYSHPKYSQGMYVDHDQASDANEEDSDKESSWYTRTSRKKSTNDGPIDYRKELALYAGSPSSSPERDGKGDSKKKKQRVSISSRARAKKLAAKRAKRKRIELQSGKPMKRLVSKKACKFFMEGNCQKGADCPYQHLKRERKKELCRYYLNGFCQKGRLCIFMHEDFPCKFYHTGAECYSGEKCRFSHKPLTEETQKLLKECLNSYQNDNHHEPRKRRSKSPEPPPKRVCLLGSPPRHIREAEETKRWQEEMYYLQREKSTDAFQINLSTSSKQFTPPHGQFNNSSRPNFYVDTMSPSNKHGWQSSEDEIMGPSVSFDQDNLPFGKEDQDLRPKVNWNSISALVDMMSENKASEQDDQKFKDDSDVDNFMADPVKQEDFAFEEREIKQEPPASPQRPEENASCPSPPVANSPSHSQDSVPVPEPDPILIPSHLPRKQRELLLRIQRHQKVKSAEVDESAEPNEKLETEHLVQSLPEQDALRWKEDYDEKQWPSSDDDDDTDEPLTDVLKKLHQTPPPKPQDIPPKLDLSHMLSTIMLKANENNKTSNYQEQGKFWHDILSGNAPASNLMPVAPSAPIVPSVVPSVPNSMPLPSKRRVLLPDPVPAEKLVPESRDPRLKSRDPRTAAPASFTPNPQPNNPVPPIVPFLPLETRMAGSIPSHHHDLNPIVLSQTSAVIVDGLSANVPYKLYNVTFLPINYSRYVHASHSDPKLVKDPRLRKYISSEATAPSQLDNLHDSQPKSSMLRDLPLFNNNNNTDGLVSSLQNNSSVMEMPHLPELKLPPLDVPVADARKLHSDEKRLIGSNTPPTAQTNSHALLPIPSPVQTVASHLPRAIADPRMAKLHKPLLDPRRARLAADSANKTFIPANKPQPVNTNTPSATEITRTDQVTSDAVDKSEDVKKTLSESKKNKAIHRNRKSSMDYASPLNSCDANNSSSLNYNSYNQRPKTRARTNAVEVPLPMQMLPTASSLVSSLIPDFSASDSSNLDCDSLDASASLKDMFKTIDPTASPFC